MIRVLLPVLGAVFASILFAIVIDPCLPYALSDNFGKYGPVFVFLTYVFVIILLDKQVTSYRYNILASLLAFTFCITSQHVGATAIMRICAFALCLYAFFSFGHYLYTYLQGQFERPKLTS